MTNTPTSTLTSAHTEEEVERVRDRIAGIFSRPLGYPVTAEALTLLKDIETLLSTLPTREAMRAEIERLRRERDHEHKLDRLNYSVDEFCKAFGISKPTLYKAWKEGRGPRCIKFGDRRLIPVEAAREFGRQLQSATSEAERSKPAGVSPASRQEVGEGL